MSPWDELRYFKLPVVTNVVGPTGGTVSAVVANPNRIAIIFATAVAGTTPGVSLPLQDGSGFATYRISDAGPWQITHKDFPGLPQQQWFTNLAAGQTLSIIEIILTEYPREKE